MDYDSLCKMIDKLNGTERCENLFSILMYEYMGNYINELNNQYFKEELVPERGIILFNAINHRLQIGNNDEVAWSLTFSNNNIKDAFLKFDNNKEEIANQSRKFAQLYHENIKNANAELKIFINKLSKDKQLIELKEKGYFDFLKITAKQWYDIKYGRLETNILYNGERLCKIYTKLYNKFDEAEAKANFKACRDMINIKFITNAINDIITNARRTGTLTRANQKALVNWAIEQQDYDLGKLLSNKRRKLYKSDRERLDGFMMTGKLAGTLNDKKV